MVQNIVILVFVILVINNEVSATNAARFKRCIVIQKQSGGRADSGEGGDDEDYDYKRPQPKAPAPDRLLASRTEGVAQKKKDVEAISPEFMKYKMPPVMPILQKLKIKDRLKNIFQQ